MKKAFWSEVFAYFEKEMGENIRGYDAIITKWKNSIRPKIVAFSVVHDSVQRMDECGSSNLAVFQKALAKYESGRLHLQLDRGSAAERVTTRTGTNQYSGLFTIPEVSVFSSSPRFLPTYCFLRVLRKDSNACGTLDYTTSC
ncbi:hypothetical protein Tco_1492545 [Tanacetum coccineum]